MFPAHNLAGVPLEIGFEILTKNLGRPKVGIGPFTAFQIALDLSYDRRFFSDNGTWVHMGPGSRRGLKLLGFRPRLEELIALYDRQPSIEYGPGRLSPADVEHALCEWQKYERALAGGHAKGSYLKPPQDRWRPPYPVPPEWVGWYKNLVLKAVTT